MISSRLETAVRIGLCPVPLVHAAVAACREPRGQRSARVHRSHGSEPLQAAATWTNGIRLHEESFVRIRTMPGGAEIFVGKRNAARQTNRSVFRQSSSVVEQGTHKPLVGSSILPSGTTFGPGTPASSGAVSFPRRKMCGMMKPFPHRRVYVPVLVNPA